MGYIRYHAIAVTSGDKAHIQIAHKKAIEMFGKKLVTEVKTIGIKSLIVDKYYLFFIWKESDTYYKKRTKFIEWIKKQNIWLSFYELCYDISV